VYAYKVNLNNDNCNSRIKQPFAAYFPAFLVKNSESLRMINIAIVGVQPSAQIDIMYGV
jgi:hypothetical protein